MPFVEDLLGGPLTLERVSARSEADLVLRAIDACLGVDGLPQSGTGQTALFVGENAAALLGRHVPAFPGARLRAMLRERSVFRRAAEAGRTVTFANAFTPRYEELIATRRRRKSASVHAIEGAGLRLRRLDDLQRGRAVTWDVLRDHFAKIVDERVEIVAPETAGHHLADLVMEHDLTLYETFLTDLAGHRRFGIEPGEALRRLDGLLRGLWERARGRATIVVTSDHGNLEESDHSRHTRNPVPLLALGPERARFREVESIAGVAAALLDAVG